MAGVAKVELQDRAGRTFLVASGKYEANGPNPVADPAKQHFEKPDVSAVVNADGSLGFTFEAELIDIPVKKAKAKPEAAPVAPPKPPAPVQPEV